MTISRLIIFLLMLTTLGSCVGKKKFLKMLDAKNDLNQTLLKTRQDLTAAQDALQHMKDSLAYQRENADDVITNLTKERDRQNEEIATLRDRLLEVEAAREDLMADLKVREKRVKDLEMAIAERDSRAQLIQKKLENALKGFQDAGLTVEYRDGKIYVSLSQELLFKTGSAYVGAEGRKALKQLAEALVDEKDLSLLIEGHTDNTGEDEINWKLSTGRSLSITYLLIENGIEPARITAAGRGKYVPLVSNDTEAGRAKNRRTEIIVEPNLQEIYDVLNDGF